MVDRNDQNILFKCTVQRGLNVFLRGGRYYVEEYRCRELVKGIGQTRTFNNREKRIYPPSTQAF